jgi:hypothetical protein
VEPGVDEQLFVLGKANEVGGVDRVDLLLGLLNARAGLEAPDVLPAVVVALLVVFLLRGERQRRPQHHVRVQKIEPLRHHADDVVRLAVEADILADRLRVASELRLPQRVAQHRLLLVAGLPFLF